MPHIYKPEEQWDTAIGFPSALAIGDSWFWYVNNNMLGTMVNHPALSNDYRNVQLVGYNGARLQDYVGAGNDAVDYGLALHDDCRGIGTAAGCLNDDDMTNMFAALRRSFDQLIAGIRSATAGRPVAAPIFIHGYDYPIPDHRGFDLGLIHAGPWLAPAMDRHGVDTDMALRSSITRLLIDRLSYRDYWTNELHPTDYGFECVFEQAWLPKLFAHGIAKRGTP